MANEMIVIIRGPQGAGKTTLAAALQELLGECGVAVTLVNEEPCDDAAEGLMDFANRAEVHVKVVTEVEP